MSTSYENRILELLGIVKNADTKPVTKADRKKLKTYRGFGPCAKTFNDSHPSNPRLKFLLGDNYKSAKKSILTSYYTPELVANEMWRGIERLGVTSGKALEPSMGRGVFLETAPAPFKGQFTGIELDKVTSKIARLLHPNETIYSNQRFEKVTLPYSGNYSVAITNPPYGNFNAFDDSFGKQSIHNYFALRSMHELHIGGVMALVVSSWLMDAKDSRAREAMNEIGELIGAVRLPNSTFKSETVEICTDILFFSRRNTPSDTEHQWLNTKQYNGATINEYFAQNPSQIVGNLSAIDSAFNHASCFVSDPQNISAELAQAINRATSSKCFSKPSQAVAGGDDNLFTDVHPQSPTALLEITSKDGEVYQRVADATDTNGTPIAQYKKLNLTKNQKNITHSYLGVKEQLKTLIDLEVQNADEYKIESARVMLNVKHDIHVANFGAINRKATKKLLRTCSWYLRTSALEMNFKSANKKTDQSESFERAIILTERVYTPCSNNFEADTELEALAISIQEKGGVDLSFIAQLLNTNVIDAKSRLLNLQLAYVDPEQNHTLELAPLYLSGDLYQKIEAAEKANLPSNVEALKARIPKPLSAEEISCTLGQTWIPHKTYAQFVASMVGEKANATIAMIENKFKIIVTGAKWELSRQWGTEDRTFEELLNSRMNGSPIKITHDKVIDTEATLEANDKADQIEAEFESWVFSCSDRRRDLVKTYNEKYNGIVEADFSSYADLIELHDATLTPHHHQKKAIARGLLTGNLIYDCAVGSGNH